MKRPLQLLPIFAREDAFGHAHIHNYLNGIANGECLECASQIRRAMAIWYSVSGGERASIFNLWLVVSNRTCLLVRSEFPTKSLFGRALRDVLIVQIGSCH